MRLVFSRIEVLHLVASVIVLTVAFAFVLNDVTASDPWWARLDVPWTLYISSLVAVSTGFVLHELAHKAVAQHYHHWAEFRGQFQGLLVSLAVAAGLGFLVAAPGAVHIWGRVTQRQNGLISIVGPGVNFVLAIVTLPVALLFDVTQPVPKGFAVVSFINAVLCAFNLVPAWNLDGRKVLRWNKPVYIVFFISALALVISFVLLGIVPFES